MDFHNPYAPRLLDTFAGAKLPWVEKQERLEKLKRLRKTATVRASKHKNNNNYYITGPPSPKSSTYIDHGRRVRFAENTSVVLVQSRTEIFEFGLDLWWSEDDISKSKVEAEAELRLSLSSNESCLTLYSAMNLLYRPCTLAKRSTKNYFRILVVDDSLVSRKMTMFDIAQGHRAAQTKELLYLQQAPDYDSALEFINSKEFNVIIVNDDLGDLYPKTNGLSLAEIIRCKSPGCVVIGMIEGDQENRRPNVTTAKTSAFMRAGADMVWQRPLACPQTAWAQLSQLLPIEF